MDVLRSAVYASCLLTTAGELGDLDLLHSTNFATVGLRKAPPPRGVWNDR
jgi:hypothetical protein